MEISLISDHVSLITQQGLNFSKFLLHHRNGSLRLHSTAAAEDRSSSAVAILDAVAPPPVKRNRYRALRMTLLRRKRRTRRASEGGDGGEYEFFGGDDGGYGGCGGGSSWGGGGGWGSWDFDRNGGRNWNFAHGFVYEVIYWIALSSCAHFAFKRVVRIVVADSEREKVVVPLRLTSVC